MTFETAILLKSMSPILHRFFFLRSKHDIDFSDIKAHLKPMFTGEPPKRARTLTHDQAVALARKAVEARANLAKSRVETPQERLRRRKFLRVSRVFDEKLEMLAVADQPINISRLSTSIFKLTAVLSRLAGWPEPAREITVAKRPKREQSDEPLV